MITNQQYSTLISRCINCNLPFVAFMFSDSNELNFFADIPDDDGNCIVDTDDPNWNGFFINFFGNDEPYLAGVRFTLDYEETCKYLSSLETQDRFFIPGDVSPSLHSTSRLDYMRSFKEALQYVKARDSKIVISQMTATLTTREPGEVMWEYFNSCPGTFRFLCFTPETGLWIGATPELLLSTNVEQKYLATMALAGTRPAEETGPWDEKNEMEHLYVTSYIKGTLMALDLDVEMGEEEEIQFGSVKHLCHMIEARGKFDPFDVLYELSPTSAIAGWPSADIAVEKIRDIEAHDRYCYGGFVGLKYGSDVMAFVNLRSALFAPVSLPDDTRAYIYNIYSGGGIVSGSEPEAEWDEAMRKCRPLLKCVTGGDTSRRPIDKSQINHYGLHSRRTLLMDFFNGKE
ncbi:MAG: chorismate-binding protein [Lachnoclostridium sp.]|nr:chorismate-binding protein [Lachnoclostridium sp.]